MTTAPDTRSQLLAAGKTALLESGYAGLSTRRIAEAAGVPLSQIHYHFGSRQNLVLAVLADENARLLERQARLYGAEMPVWRQWEQACDFLEDDLRSGYVRVLQEMTAAGWSDDADRRGGAGQPHRLVRAAHRHGSRRSAPRFGDLGPFTPAEIATLAGTVFLGIETMILLGFDEEAMPCRSALRSIGFLLRSMEEAPCALGLPTSSARSSATASRSATSGTATRRPPTVRRSCSCRRGRSSTPASGSCRSRTSPATSPSSSTTARAMAAPTGRPTRPATPAAPTPRRGRRRSTRAASSGPSSSGCRCGARYAVELAALRPDLVAGLVLIGPSLPVAPMPPERQRVSERFLDSGTGASRRLGALQPGVLARPLRRLRAVVLRAAVPRAALDQADRGRRRLGRRDRRDHPRGRGAPAGRAADRCASCSTSSRCPTLVVHGDDDRVGGPRGRRRGGPAHRRDPRDVRGLGPHAPTSATRCGSTCSSATSPSGWRRESGRRPTSPERSTATGCRSTTRCTAPATPRCC